MLPCIRRARVPRDLAAVTSIRADEEADPRSVGASPDGIARVWAAVERLYASGIHPAVQLCVRRHGRVLLDRAIGHAHGNGPDDPRDGAKVPVTPDTPFCTLSASKAVTAMVVHLLDQRERDPPRRSASASTSRSSAVTARSAITIRHVLAHRAGIPNLPPQVMRLDRLDDLDEVMDILCDAEPVARPGRQLAYHAVTGGFVLGEVVRRVTGRSIRERARRRRSAGRSGSAGSRTASRPTTSRGVATNYVTGPPVLAAVLVLLPARARRELHRRRRDVERSALPHRARARRRTSSRPRTSSAASTSSSSTAARSTACASSIRGRSAARPPSSPTSSSTSRSACRSATGWASCSARSG